MDLTIAGSRATLSVVFSALFLLIPSDRAGATSKCPRNDTRQVATPLKGNVSIGSETFVYESRIETLQKPASGNEIDTIRYIYCISNQRQYRSVRILWHHNNKEQTYFEGAVPPGAERFEYQDTTVLKRASAPRTLQYGVGEVKRDTHFPDIRVPVNDNNIGIKSGAVLDIPIHFKIHSALLSDKSEKYNPEDFLTMSLTYTSSLRISGDNRHIFNSLVVDFLGDTKFAAKALSARPKYLRATSEDSRILGESNRGLGIPISMKGGEPIVSVESTVQGPVVEKSASIQITDGKIVLGSFGIKYFGQK